jgi:mono/diheme cytochrome c family protein
MAGKIVLALTLIAAAVLAQASRSVWDCVYTDAQAKRGQALFEQNCVSCHGPALEGDGEALSPEASADLLAYVLQFNKFPGGEAELPHDAAALNQIRYESKKPAKK